MQNERGKTIRYFSMFTGVGGFELGISRSCRDVECHSKEEKLLHSEGDKSILEGQEESHNPTDSGQSTNTKNSIRALLQNGQVESNPKSANLGATQNHSELRQSLRQASSGILRERDGIRDDSQSLQQRENIANSCKFGHSSERATNNRPTGQKEQNMQTNKNCSNSQEGNSWESANGDRELLQEQTSESNKDCSESEVGQNRFTCVGMSENNKYASELLAQKFPTVKNYGDCTKINPEKLPDFDFLCGGFPCQSFSIAGKRKGFDDTRGTMFFEVARILKVKRPKIVLLENVKGLLNHEKGKTFSVILETLDELGYETQWMVLNSKFFGVPQNRERVFIIGSLRGEPRPEILPLGEDDKLTNKGTPTISREIPTEETGNCLTSRYYKMSPTDTYISYVKKDKSQHSRVYSSDGIAPTLAGASKLSGDCTPKILAVLTPDRPEKRQNGRRFKEDGEPSFTLTGQDVHGIMQINPSKESGGKQPYQQNRIYNKEGIIPALPAELGGERSHLVNTTKIRRLTPIECERLQGFPDGWTEGFSNTQRYKMIGNAVTVNVIQAIISRLPF